MRRMFLGALLVVLAACGSDTTTGPDVDLSFVGTYTLRTIDGSKLPYVFLQTGQDAAAMTASTIVIADGGTWSEQSEFRITDNGQTETQVVSNNGTWFRSANNLILTSTLHNNTPYSGTFSTNQLTLSDGSLTYVFSR